MAQERPPGPEGLRQRRKPLALRRSDRFRGIPVGGSHGLDIGRQELTLVISLDGRQFERHQPIGRLARQQGARQQVAEIDDDIRAAPPNVVEHRVECAQVSMNVRDGCNTHGT